MIEIDGSEGEGGGQILRTALALSIITKRAFSIRRIRGGRAKPGLLRQHLTGVQAAARIGCAEVHGASLGSTELSFAPQSIAGGEYRFAIGSAGSAMLVLQTVLPPLLLADRESRLILEGGTHNMASPPFDFVERCFAPVLRRMGAKLDLRLERRGFYPAGGGKLEVDIAPSRLAPIELLEAGPIRRRSARAIVAKLPAHVAERELTVVRARLGWSAAECAIDEDRASIGPGNALLLEIVRDELTEVVTAFGARGVSAEEVGSAACAEVERLLAADAPVGEHLADQLLLPMALAGGGAFRTVEPTEHTRTNIATIRRFLEVDLALERGGTVVRVR